MTSSQPYSEDGGRPSSSARARSIQPEATASSPRKCRKSLASQPATRAALWTSPALRDARDAFSRAASEASVSPSQEVAQLSPSQASADSSRASEDSNDRRASLQAEAASAAFPAATRSSTCLRS